MDFNSQNVKHLMIRDGLKQKQLASMLGMHSTAFNYSLSSGKTTRDVAEKLATIFKVPLSEIVIKQSDVIIPDMVDGELVQKIEQVIDRRLEVRLAPLVESMKLLNKLIDLANAAINKTN